MDRHYIILKQYELILGIISYFDLIEAVPFRNHVINLSFFDKTDFWKVILKRRKNRIE